MTASTLGAPTVLRTRLVEPLSTAEVVALVAPGGYGKSTLAEQLVARWDVAPVRLRLRTPTDSDGLIDGLRRALARSGWRDLAAAIGDESADAAIDRLIGALHDGDTPIALVIDDVQLLDTTAWALVDSMMTDLPADCRLLVCGRELPGSARVPIGVVFVGADDLRMSDGEIAELLGLAIGASLVQDVAAVTAGWTTAVAVAAHRLRAEPSWSPVARGAGTALLVGLIEPAIAAERDVLVPLARVPLIDADVAELVAGPGALDRLRRSAVPTRTDHGHWTVIPDAARDALVALDPAGGRLDGSLVAEVAGRYAMRGELQAALTLVATSDDPDHAAALLHDRHWSELEHVGFAQLDHLVARIPDGVLARRARVLVSLAQAAELHRPELRRGWLARLATLPDVPEPVVLAGDAERARDLMRSVRLDEAIALAESVIARASLDDVVTRGRAQMSLAHALAFTAQPDAYDRASRAFAEAAELLGVAGEHRWQAEALARLGYNVLFHSGKVVEAAERLDRALALLPASDTFRATWLSNYAEVLEWRGDTALGDACTAEALEIGTRLHDATSIGMVRWTRAWQAGWRRDLVALRAELAAIEALQPGFLEQSNGVEVYGSLCDFFASLGDVELTDYCAAKTRELGERFDYRQAIDFMTVRVEALLGDPAVALDLLARIDGGHGGPRNTQWVRRLEAAIAHLRLGDEAAARADVETALRQCTMMGLPDLPQRLESPLVERLAAVWPGGEAAVAEPSTAISVLGGFAVRRGHEDVTPPAGHPSTLVKLLVLQRSMTADGVIEALWPDADVDTGRARLRNTMNRLRSRSGPVVERRADSIELGERVETDLDAFERAAATALAADDATRVGLARQAIALYAGELLPGDVFEDWAAAPRERLRRRFLALVDLVADATERAGNLDEAARLYDLGITADPLDESRYERLATVLVDQGRTGAARAVAERAAAVLAELGLPLGRELSRLIG